MDQKSCFSCDYIHSTFATEVAAGAKYRCSHCGKMFGIPTPAYPPSIDENSHMLPGDHGVPPAPLPGTPTVGNVVNRDPILRRIDLIAWSLIGIMSLTSLLYFSWVQHLNLQATQSKFDKLLTTNATIDIIHPDGNADSPYRGKRLCKDTRITYMYKVDGFTYRINVPYEILRYEIEDHKEAIPVEGEVSKRIQNDAQLAVHYAKDQPFLHLLDQSKSYAEWHESLDVWYNRGILRYVSDPVYSWLSVTLLACGWYFSLRAWAMARAVSWQRFCLLLVAGMPIVAGLAGFFISYSGIEFTTHDSEHRRFNRLARCHVTNGRVFSINQRESVDYMYQYTVSKLHYNNESKAQSDEHFFRSFAMQGHTPVKDGDRVLVLYDFRSPAVSASSSDGISLHITNYFSYATIFGSRPYPISADYCFGASMAVGFVVGWIPGLLAWIVLVIIRQWRGITGSSVGNAPVANS